RDVKPFDQMLDAHGVAPVQTNPMHLGARAELASLKQEIPEERAPDGNAVSLEGQMTKVADDQTNAELVGNLWKSYMGMYMTALGKG
ncbi:MAG TPA: flagellar biosynthesis protein FlgB, partial [Acetobacteraceae bacterium]|nr:flagellar biosynthesis protein FlgB [Acetobacteraceae bacterium]